MRFLMKDPKFNYFKEKVLEHLKSLEAEENKSIKKSLLDAESIVKGGKGLPVGTVQTWHGKNGETYKVRKVAPGKWRKMYQSDSRGAKLAIAALRKKAEKCKDSQELMQLILENRDRFSDDKGRPIPLVQELSKYVSSLNDEIVDRESKKNAAKKTKAKKTTKKETVKTEKTPKERRKQNAQARKEVAFEQEEKRLLEIQSKRTPAKTKEDAIKDLEKHIEHINSIKPENETDYEKADREGKTEATQSIIQKIKDGVTKILELFVSSEKPNETEQKPNEKTESKQRTLENIKADYKKAKSVTGNRKTIHVGDEKIKCHYKLVEADTPTASHDEKTFNKTEGFPTVNGGSVNDNDYQNSREAQESVYRIAAKYDGRAIEDPPILTKDGIVVSGNNRTMSSKIAAKRGTDKEYLNELAETIEDFGIDEEELKNFKNPRLVLEIDEEHSGDYTTQEFAKYNKSGKKEKSVTEKAVVIAKTINENTVSSVAEQIAEFETLGELYADRNATEKVVNLFVENGLIQPNELAQYYDENGLSNNGKEFIETVLVGSILNENNIRSVAGDGGKSLRQKLVRGIVPLVENKGLSNEYSFNNELNEAVSIAAYINKNEDIKRVSDYFDQKSLFDEKEPSELTKKLTYLIHDSTQKDFAETMRQAEGGLKVNADGQADLFLGECESRESVLNRILKITSDTMKKAFGKIKDCLSFDDDSENELEDSEEETFESVAKKNRQALEDWKKQQDIQKSVTDILNNL